VRIILHNDVARQLRETLEAGSSPTILAKTRVGDGGEIFVVAGGVEFPGIARREPNAHGRVRVEDLDGRIVMETGAEHRP
jgi:hypothetical protein